MAVAWRELDVLVEEIQRQAALIRTVTPLPLDSEGGSARPDDAVVNKLLEALNACNATIQKALDWTYSVSDGADPSVLSDEYVVVEEDAEPQAVTTVEVKETLAQATTNPPMPRLVRANAGVYESDDLSPPTTPHGSSSQPKPFSSKVALETVNHLLFVIHGIGPHADFKDTHSDYFAENISDPKQRGKSQLLKELFRTTRDAYLATDIPLALEIQTIEWHDVLHTAAVDAAFDQLVPDGANALRHFNKMTIMDMLYYSSPTYGQLVVDAVTSQMNAKYKRFLHHHPGWNGHVSIFAHSLGSVIAYDILSHAAGASSATGVTFPGLDFPVENFFAAGSPVPIMLLARGEVELSEQPASRSTPVKSRPQCAHYFNFIHPSDPIAYRMEPLLCREGSSTAAPASLCAMFDPKSLQGISFSDLYSRFLATMAAPSTTADAPTCVDYYLKRQTRDGTSRMMDVAYAPASHKSYWTSQDVVLAALLQICRPVGEILQRYDAAQVPRPELRPRRRVSFTPHKSVLLATTAVARDRITGTWHDRVVLLANKHVYSVASVKDLAVAKSWAVSLTASSTSVVAVDDVGFKVTTTTDAKGTVLQAASREERDAWVDAIRERIGHKAKATVNCDGLVVGSNLSVDYFGAVKTSMLAQGWSTKWVVLTKSHLTAYDACPAAVSWWQFSVTTVIVSPSQGRFRFVSPDGTAFTFKIPDPATFSTWLQAVQDRKHCHMTIERDEPLSDSPLP